MARIKYYDPETNEWKYADSNAIVNITGYATEIWVQDNYQEKGNYLTEVPAGYAKTEDIPTEQEIIQLIEEHAPESSGGGIAVTGATVGQTVKISAVDENGVPTAWLPTDFPSGGGSGGGNWRYLGRFETAEEVIDFQASIDEDGKPFSLREVYVRGVVMPNTVGATGWIRPKASGGQFAEATILNGLDGSTRTMGRAFAFTVIAMEGRLFLKDAVVATNTASVWNILTDRCKLGTINHNVSSEKITSIGMFGHQAGVIGIGSYMEVWGIDA